MRASVGFHNLQTDAGRGVVAEGGKFSVLIPAETDVLVLVEQVDPGHDDYSIYTTKVNLEPGQKMHIEVPLYKSPTRPSESDSPQ